MEYKYYVVYSYTSPVTVVGMGTCEVTTHFKMNNIKNINNVRKYIAENYLDGHDCVIMNFIKLKK